MTRGSRLHFTLIALAYALPIEIHYKLFATFEPKAIIAATIVYGLYMQPVYSLHRRIDGWLTNTKWADLAFYLGVGLCSVLLLEWGIAGNSPEGNPNASQLGMLVYHAAYPFIARMYACNEDFADALRLGILRYFLAFLALSLFGLLLTNESHRFGWFIFFPLFGYAGFWFFMYRFLRNRKEAIAVTPSSP